MISEMEKKVYDFNDYRDFLEYCFKERKKKVPTTSFQGFALASQRSRAYLKNVLSKKRHLSLEAIEDVSQYFNLSIYEQEYVLYQFLASQVSIKQVKTHFDTTLKILKQQMIDASHRQALLAKNGISTAQKAHLFAHLKDAIAAAYARDKKFTDDSDWVARSLLGPAKVTKTEAAEIVKRLLKAEILKRKPDGSMEMIEDQFCKIHPAEFNYFKSALQMTIDALADIAPHEPSRFELGVMSFSDQTYQKVKTELLEFTARMGTYSKQDHSPDKKVFLTNFSLLCIAKEDK